MSECWIDTTKDSTDFEEGTVKNPVSTLAEAIVVSERYKHLFQINSLGGNRMSDELRPIADIVNDLNEWAHKNFADSNAWEPLVGMGEEIGELVYPLRYDERVDVIDALGDILIYSVDFARRIPELNWMGLYNGAMHDSDASPPDSMMAYTLKSDYGFLGQLIHSHGKLSHHFLKQHQGIRLTENHSVGMLRNLMGIIKCIEVFSRLSLLLNNNERPFNVHRLLAITAEQVLKRDWTKEHEESSNG